MDISVQIAGIRLEHPVMNAAGTCRYLQDVIKLKNSAAAAVMIGSITWEAREGNAGEVYWAGPMYSLNSLGLPNPGAAWYESALPEMAKVVHGEGKPLFVSVAGFSPTEYAKLAALAFEGGADLVELNLGCPNVWGSGGQKPIASFNTELVNKILEETEGAVGTSAAVSAKVSPFSNPLDLQSLAGVFDCSLLIKVVTTSNTFPNAFDFNELGQPRITPAEGFAGFAGLAMKPIGLGQVRQWRKVLPERIQIIGVGGVASQQDVRDYLASDADAVQIATAYLGSGTPRPQVFSEILTGMLPFDEDSVPF